MKNNVTVYTTSTCPYCDMMKNFLKDKDIPFHEVNVQKTLWLQINQLQQQVRWESHKRK